MDKTGPCPGDRETGSLQAILDLLSSSFSDSDALCTSLFKNACYEHELASEHEHEPAPEL